MSLNLIFKIALLIVIYFSLSACAAISPEKCKTADWYNLGYSDGQNGAKRDRVNDYTQACAEVNIKVNIEKWQTGYEKGNQIYCTPENGYRIGRAGQTYNGVCLSQAFVKNYNKGKRQYDIAAEINELENRIYDLKEQYRTEPNEDIKREIRHDIRDLERRLDLLRVPQVLYEVMHNTN